MAFRLGGGRVARFGLDGAQPKPDYTELLLQYPNKQEPRWEKTLMNERLLHLDVFATMRDTPPFSTAQASSGTHSWKHGVLLGVLAFIGTFAYRSMGWSKTISMRVPGSKTS